MCPVCNNKPPFTPLIGPGEDSSWVQCNLCNTIFDDDNNIFHEEE